MKEETLVNITKIVGIITGIGLIGTLGLTFTHTYIQPIYSIFYSLGSFGMIFLLFCGVKLMLLE